MLHIKDLYTAVDNKKILEFWNEQASHPSPSTFKVNTQNPNQNKNSYNLFS